MTTKNEDNSVKQNLLDEMIEKLSINWEITKIIFLLLIFLGGEGLVMIGISLIVPVIAKPWDLSGFEKGFLGGSVFLGFTIGALIAGYFSDNYGRKNSTLIGALFSLIGGSICVFFMSYFSLVFSNFMIGIGFGIAIPSIFSLVAEVTPSDIRTTIFGWGFLIFPVGEIIGCLMAKRFHMFEFSNSNWQLLLIVRVVPVFKLVNLVYDNYPWDRSHFGKSEILAD